ncbi:MAG TPA: response regulator [Thermoanaerobaculia bacterium]
MTAETRRRIFRYGIAIDLVILATGFGLLDPAALPLLFIAFLGAVMLSVWKGGWSSGVLAIVLSLIALMYFFGATFDATRLVSFAGAGVAACFIIRQVMTTRAPRLQYVASAPANVVAFERSALDPDDLIRESHQREVLARGLERTAAEQLEAQRETIRRREEERAREAEERARREAEEAQREAEAVLAQRLAAEREAIEREARESHERAQRQLEEERLAAAREAEEIARREAEAARVAAEAELERRRAELEREAAEAAQRAAEAEERARATEAELAQKLAAEREARERAEREAEEARRLAEAERVRLQQEAEERAAREAEAAAEAARTAAEAELALRLADERTRADREAEELARREAEAAKRAAAAELEQRLAAEREARERAEREAEEVRRQAEAERVLAAREAEKVKRQTKAELARKLAEEREARQRAESEAAAALERAQREAEAAKQAAETELAEKLAAEREAIEREMRDRHERLQQELEEARLVAQREAEARARREVEEARHASEETLTRKLTEERERVEREAKERVEKLERELEFTRRDMQAFIRPRTGLVDTVKGWFRREPPRRTNLNLKTKKVEANKAPAPAKSTGPAAPPRRPAPSRATERKPRILLLEKRRGTADTVVPKLRQKGTEVQIVERWVDAVDELFRFRPDAIFIDTELPDFEKVYHSITDQNHNLPVFLTARATQGFIAPPAGVRYVSVVTRPYDPDELLRHAQTAVKNPENLLARQTMSQSTERKLAPIPLALPDAPKPKPVAVPSPAASSAPAPAQFPAAAASIPEFIAVATDDKYEVTCINCRTGFDALESDWCSCLTKERTLVCTNCLTCFCKAAPAYKEKFWVSAPPRLFERKASEARHSQNALPQNPAPEDVRRPLVLTVEDDEEIQVIVQRVCQNLGYGFVHALNGQDGLTVARTYRPNLILSDAFMPKLDGREMCRILREEPAGADIKMVVMTGLYTDTKYRSEAIKRFHVDDYLSKPVAITDLINLLQRHLEGVTDLPVQEDLHDLHRRHTQEVPLPDGMDEEEDMALADLLEEEAAAEAGENNAAPEAPLLRLVPKEEPLHDAYEVCCFTCNETFDATRAEWCSCLGRDQTLACSHCGTCFCKAPSAYRERFWIDAPPSLFERKMIGSKRSLGARQNPLPHEVKRPLILLVEDDENIQLIVRTVVTTMGFGFIVGANGQEGLALAREYNPDLILSDAFMPKLDGREMCRLLKEDPVTARAKAIIMTGLYTDRKYRNEALDYFKVDDYVAKPLAVDDLIKLFKKHLPQEVQATM